MIETQDTQRISKIVSLILPSTAQSGSSCSKDPANLHEQELGGTSSRSAGQIEWTNVCGMRFPSGALPTDIYLPVNYCGNSGPLGDRCFKEV